MKNLILANLFILISNLSFSQVWGRDLSFQPPYIVGGGYLDAIATQSDGKIILAGEMDFDFGGNPSVNICRMNSNGSKDSSFLDVVNFDLGFTSWPIHLAVQPDDKILAGSFYLTRFNADGSPDTSFAATSPSPFGVIYTLAIQNNGKIIVGGDLNGNNIIRLNSDGSLDPSFDYGYGTLNETTIVGSLVLDDGKILIESLHSLILLNPDGSVVQYYNGISAYHFEELEIQSDGKMLLSLGGTARRYNSDGSLDTMFNAVTLDGGFATLYEIRELPDNKIMIGGDYIYINENYYCGLTLLDSYGNIIENGFEENLCLSTPGSINDMLLQPDGKLLIAGTWNEGFLIQRLEYIPLVFPPLELNTFVSPSVIDSCTGELFIMANGTSPFLFDISNQNSITSLSGVVYEDSLCPGVYSMISTDSSGDTINSTFVIPSDSTFLLISPFINGEIITDSLSVVFENCQFNYGTIDSIFIADYYPLINDSVEIVWGISSSNGLEFVSTIFELLPGNNYVQLQFYCPQKSVITDYFVTTIGVVNNGGQISLGLTEAQISPVSIFPNPASEAVKVKFDGFDAILTIYDLNGNIIEKHSVFSEDEISIQNLESGIYFFEINNDQFLTIKRIIKN